MLIASLAFCIKVSLKHDDLYEIGTGMFHLLVLLETLVSGCVGEGQGAGGCAAGQVVSAKQRVVAHHTNVKKH